jgi:hypothetical protein
MVFIRAEYGADAHDDGDESRQSEELTRDGPD